MVAAPSPLAPATVAAQATVLDGGSDAVSGRTDYPVRTCSGSSTVKSSVSPTVAGIAATVGVAKLGVAELRLPARSRWLLVNTYGRRAQARDEKLERDAAVHLVGPP